MTAKLTQRNVELTAAERLARLVNSLDDRRDGEFTLAEFRNASGKSEGAAGRLLVKLIEAGLITRRDAGKQKVYYRFTAKGDAEYAQKCCQPTIE